jgi:hypothetical protein
MMLFIERLLHQDIRGPQTSPPKRHHSQAVAQLWHSTGLGVHKSCVPQTSSQTALVLSHRATSKVTQPLLIETANGEKGMQRPLDT